MRATSVHAKALPPPTPDATADTGLSAGADGMFPLEAGCDGCVVGVAGCVVCCAAEWCFFFLAWCSTFFAGAGAGAGLGVEAGDCGADLVRSSSAAPLPPRFESSFFTFGDTFGPVLEPEWW